MEEDGEAEGPLDRDSEGESTEKPVYLSGELSFEAKNDFTVVASLTDEARIPIGTELTVREVLPGTEEYRQYLEEAHAILDEEWNELTDCSRFFDICFMLDHVEIEPAVPVEIRILFADDPEVR